MCGIAGIICNGRKIVEAALRDMITAQAHRGPDDEGVVVLGAAECWIGLGHKRLAIIDLSPSGHQPMEDPERGNWIVFNGEIYNFRDLRRELEDRGEWFRTATDTEVILKAYGLFGRDCVKRLRGIFALGLWDRQRHSLLLARNPLGVKPLYLLHEGSQLIFASEVRAILATRLIPTTLDLEGLHSFLAFGSVQEPFTLVQGIQSLPPGHLLELEPEKAGRGPSAGTLLAPARS